MLELQGCITENHWTSLKIKRLNCSQLTSPRIHEGQCKSLVLRFFVFKAYASLIYGSGKKCPHLKVHLWLYVFVDIRYRRYVAGALALGFSLQALRHCGFSFFFIMTLWYFVHVAALQIGKRYEASSGAPTYCRPTRRGEREPGGPPAPVTFCKG